MFDAYMQDHGERARGRRHRQARSLLAAGVVGAVALSLVVASSYTDVEELAGPDARVPVILIAAPPPPPPPLERIAACGQPGRRLARHAEPALAPPTAGPAAAPGSRSSAGARAVNGSPYTALIGDPTGTGAFGLPGGGDILGPAPGGADTFSPSGAPPAPRTPRVAPDVAESHLLVGDPEALSRPPAAVAAHVFGRTDVEVCVDASGFVGSVRPLRSLPWITDHIARTIETTWRYRPFLVDGRPAPSCFVLSFVYQDER